MKSQWKTLLQAVLISAIVVGIYTFLVIYSLAEQIVPGAAGTVEKHLDFGNPLVLESLPGLALMSILNFFVLTIILYIVIFLIKKWKKSRA